MANWIWYPGDFEIYHGMCQNFDREERGFFWPAYWHVADCRHHVVFHAKYELKEKTAFTVWAQGIGHVQLKWTEDLAAVLPEGENAGEAGAAAVKRWKEWKAPLGEEIRCPAGLVFVDVVVGNRTGLPCILAEGDVICSGEDWTVTDFVSGGVPVGLNDMYTRADQDPQRFEYTSCLCMPETEREADGGILYDFGTEITAELLVRITGDRPERVTLCYGESEAEALDTQMCYLKQVLEIPSPEAVREQLGRGERTPFGCWEDENTYHTKLRAFRYVYVPEREAAGRIRPEAVCKYVDFPVRSGFTCEDPLLNRIWEVADHTFRLCSGIFFLDGIKRDRWIWSGDAYQSYFINQYLFADREICKRTILALRGNDPIVEHINTIVDYSMYWVISIENYYNMTGDAQFVRQIYPKMQSMMEYLDAQTDEQGFLYGRPGDWIYIDWANMDKDGTLCAEQMLLARSYQAMCAVRRLLGMDSSEYEEKRTRLLANIRKFFWDDEKGAFIDSYTSGRRNVTRHANIFALLFGYADEEQAASIMENVLLNDQVEAITTPYFKFYELEALALQGRFDLVMTSIRSYWGSMLEAGASTFWEEYRPGQPAEEQYGMYGDPFGKSLCHAWGASPIYLLGRYCCGVRSTAPGYASFEVAPRLELFREFSCFFPVNEGTVYMNRKDGCLEVWADRDGGVLKVNGQEYVLEKDVHLTVRI